MAEQVIEPGDILRDTAPRPVDGFEHRYELVIPEAWKVMYAFGGVTFAAALRAIEAAVDRDDLRLVSAEGTFCQAIPTGAVAIDVEVLRQGRSGAQAQARMWATDDPTGDARGDLVVNAVLGAPRQWHEPVIGRTFPEHALLPEDSRIRIEPPEDSDFPRIPYHDQTDWRIATGRAPWDPDDGALPEPWSVSWFRFHRSPARPDGTWEPATLAVPGDILGPAVLGATRGIDGFFFVITLQMSVQFFAPMRGDWLLQHTRATSVADGFATGVADLWSEDGVLVGQASQTALLQPMKPG
jgi:acyl-CoA thioesterase